MAWFTKSISAASSPVTDAWLVNATTLVGGGVLDEQSHAARDAGSATTSAVDGKTMPPLAAQAASFLGAAVAFVGDGCALVDDAEHRRRLDVCRLCNRSAGRRCTACGCFIAVKARGRAFTCPIGSWPGDGKSKGPGE